MSTLIGLLFIIFMASLITAVGFGSIIIFSYITSDKEEQISIQSFIQHCKETVSEFKTDLNRQDKTLALIACFIIGIGITITVSFVLLIAQLVGGAIV